ncbi:MAG: FHA domain-containing protein [Acidobacteria bacterium]|nr:FHA domain-containing protein [Acidobacteriota bacterium]MCY4601736.1 FHA domain-containing protein [Acidobacteriota bacterium]
MWILRSNDASHPVALRLLPGAAKTVGRATAANFDIDATLVSRLHCRLSASSTELIVEDLGSTNGTYVNERRVQKAALRAGDHLRLGDVVLSVARE